MQHAEHRIVFAENAANRSGGIDAQRLQFAQQKQSEYVIEIGIGEHYARNRATGARRRADAIQAWLRFARAGQETRRAETTSGPSCVIATWVWVRGLPWKVPARMARQFAQAQFHCGNAPPAADPRIFTCISGEFTAWDYVEGAFR